MDKIIAEIAQASSDSRATDHNYSILNPKAVLKLSRCPILTQSLEHLIDDFRWI